MTNLEIILLVYLAGFIPAYLVTKYFYKDMYGVFTTKDKRSAIFLSIFSWFTALSIIITWWMENADNEKDVKW